MSFGTAEAKLESLGIALPPTTKPVAADIPAIWAGDLINVHRLSAPEVIWPVPPGSGALPLHLLALTQALT